MNNARYVREMDFARFHFYDRTGLYDQILEGKGNALQGACNIRYRRTIPIFTPYKVTTQVPKKFFYLLCLKTLLLFFLTNTIKIFNELYLEFVV